MSIDEIEKRRLLLQKAIPLGILIVLPVAFSGLLLINYSWGEVVFTFSMGILLAYLVYILWVYNSYVRIFKQSYLPAYIATYFPSFTYHAQPIISQQQFHESNIISHDYQSFHVQDCISTQEFGGVIIADIEVIKHANNTKKDRTVLFKGLFVQAQYPFNFDGETYITPKSTPYAYPTHHLETVKLESVRFNEIWNVYSDNQIGARLALRTDIMNNLLYLHEQLRTDIWIRFAQKKLYICIKDESFLEPPFFTPLTSSSYHNTLKQEIHAILAIIHTYKLSQNS